MGFWEYPDTPSEDEDSGDTNRAVLAKHRSPKLNRLGTKKLSDLDGYNARPKPSENPAIVIADEDDDLISPPRKKKRKSVLAKLSLEQETALSPQATAEAIRLQQLRAQAMQAFQDDDDEDGEDGSSVEDEEMTRTLPVQVRAPARLVEDIDDAEDVEAELEAEKQLLMRQGADATGGAMVLKVQCEKGEVQIRQQPGSNFVGLMDKFRAYAEKQGWAKKSTKMILECDGDRVDLKNSSPEEFDLEDGMALDVVMK